MDDCNTHRSCVPRERYRLISGGAVLTWERSLPNDSRVELVSCDADWFYGQMVGVR